MHRLGVPLPHARAPDRASSPQIVTRFIVYVPLWAVGVQIIPHSRVSVDVVILTYETLDVPCGVGAPETSVGLWVGVVTVWLVVCVPVCVCVCVCVRVCMFETPSAFGEGQ